MKVVHFKAEELQCTLLFLMFAMFKKKLCFINTIIRQTTK